MENKLKKKSINTVIYLLLAAMLVCVVFVSVYTVASKRSKPPVDSDVIDSGTGEVSDKTDDKSDSAAVTDTSAVTDKTDTSASESASVTDPAGEDTPSAVTEPTELPTSVDLRCFVLPVDGTPAKEFEIDIPVYSLTMNDYRAHTGVDISTAVGSDVLAASSGVICRIWSDPMMGRSVTIDHGDGIYTTYMNLAEEVDPALEVGGRVELGQRIGSVGETSLTEIAEEPHLHLEMKIGGQYVNPLDYIEASAELESEYYEE